MNDPRLTPANERVAAAELEGSVDSPRFSHGQPMQVAEALVDLFRTPTGPRDRQLIFGDGVRVFEVHEGMSFVQSAKDGYVGYVPQDVLEPAQEPTHWVTAPSSHRYPLPTMKSHELGWLSCGSLLAVSDQVDGFAKTTGGEYVPSQHISPVGTFDSDPVAVAERFLGTPYLWGGNSRAGIDCSGLVQLSHLACGLPCAGDSDLQMGSLGAAMPEGTALERGDLLFWKGHVAMVASPDMLIHANAFHMAVAFEPTSDAIDRIRRETGPVLAHKRLELD